MDNENINELQPPPEPVTKGESELYSLLSGFVGKIFFNPVIRKTVLVLIISFAVIISVFLVFAFYVYFVPGLQEFSFSSSHKLAGVEELKAEKQYKNLIVNLSKEVQRSSRKFAAYTPGQSYLVINTTDNRFRLYKNKQLVREGYCSSGSYIHLQSSEGTRHWIFKTPKGKFWIQQKITKPLWKRPDWSFVEEGLPIPPPDDPSRYEFGVLGDYAMSLGDGYLIHGTIYKRLLGMPVTHGCIRLNDADLEVIFKTLGLGSKVYIL